MPWPQILMFILLHLCTLFISEVEGGNGTTEQTSTTDKPLLISEVEGGNVTVTEQGSTNTTDKPDHTVDKKANGTVSGHGSVFSTKANLYNHLGWGKPEDRLWNGTTSPTERIYFGYGQCRKRWPIYYKHILEADQVHVIISYYAEMFRKDCLPSYVQSLRDLFEKGYARLNRDGSIGYSETTILFVRRVPTFQNIEDLESLLEIAAFTQTFVAWSKYPLNPLDPVGNQLSDNCFIEIVARLHALDLIIAVSKRHLERVAYGMGVKLKPVLAAMCADYRKIKGYGGIVEKKRTIARQCVAVTMGLFEFLFQKSSLALKSRCAHEAFKEYFTKRATAYENFARRYGRFHGKMHGQNITNR